MTTAGSPAADTLSVIAPCLNEEKNIPLLVERMMATFDQLEIRAELVLIDDGSTDGTWSAILASMQSHLGRIRGERHDKNRGIIVAWKTGLAVSQGELVCLIDADLQNRPEDIPRLYATYKQGDIDIVQAVRHPVGSTHRLVYSRALNHLLNLSFGMKLRDNKSGFLLCRRAVLLDSLAGSEGYRYFQCFVGVAAHLHGYRFSEVDTVFHNRHAGASFLSGFPLTILLRICGELLRYRWAMREFLQPESRNRPAR